MILKLLFLVIVDKSTAVELLGKCLCSDVVVNWTECEGFVRVVVSLPTPDDTEADDGDLPVKVYSVLTFVEEPNSGSVVSGGEKL